MSINCSKMCSYNIYWQTWVCMNIAYKMTSCTTQTSVSSEGHSCTINDTNTIEKKWFSSVHSALGKIIKKKFKGFTHAGGVENIANTNMK